MFMMTTEKDKRNDQDTRINFDSYNHHTDFVQSRGKSFQGETLTIPKNYESPKSVSYDKFSPTTDKSFINQDEGYGTDSKSNTSPSTASPSSSSCLSLSTFDGSFNSPTATSCGGTSLGTHNNMNHTAMHGNTQRAPTQKLSLIQGNGKILVNRHAVVAAKKKDIPQEPQDSPVNLEDRLRALTTIEEEEPGSSKETFRKVVDTAPRVRDPNLGYNQIVGGSDTRGASLETHGPDSNSGFFRAVPVEIVAPQYSNDQRYSGDNLDGNFANPRPRDNELVGNSFPVGPSPLHNANEKNWHDYKRYFEKDCDIPLHNIDSTNRGKFVNTRVETIPDKDINRQLRTNSPAATHGGQPGANVPTQSRQQPGLERGLIDRVAGGEHGGNVRFHENPGQNRSIHQAASIYGYRPGQHDQCDRENGLNQNNSSSSLSDLRYHSLPRSVQSSSFNRSGDPYDSYNQHLYQQDQWNSMPQFHHHQPLQQQQQLQQQQHQQHYHHQQQQQHHQQQQEQQQQQQQRQQLQQQQQQYMSQQQNHQHHHLQSPHHQEVHSSNQQQSIDDRLRASQSWSSQDHITSSYNSLPRNHDGQRQHHMLYSDSQRNLTQFPEEDVTLRRSWATSSSRAIPERGGRFSWQPDSRSQHLLECEKLNSMSSDRYSLDLGNIPQLQKQIRATSEMCLQASKRHTFASSADIYKLFQGQKKPAAPTSSSSTNDLSRSQDNSHRHSFHVLPGGSWNSRSHQPLQQNQVPFSRDIVPAAGSAKHNLLSTNQHPFHRAPSSPGPLRADHSIPIHQTAWNGNNFIPPTSSSSAHPHPPPMSEIPQIQRQSSGYSSENELQQIEQNAKAAKRTKNRNELHSSQAGINSDQEFVPVDPLLDHDSSSSIIENEPVYVNQPMLANARARGSHSKASPLQQWHNTNNQSQSQFSTPPPPPVPARPQQSQSLPATAVSHPDLRDHISGYDVMLSEHQNKQNMNMPVNKQMITRQNSSPASMVITQNQTINLNRKPVTIRSFVPNFSYTNTNASMGESAVFVQGEQFLSPPEQPELRLNGENVPNGLSDNDNNLLVGGSKGSNYTQPQRSSASPCIPLSPLEVAQVLDMPFETNVISDEDGDRLSTLV